MPGHGAEPDTARDTHFHPSFGEPGASFTYLPKHLDAACASDDAPRLPIVLPDAPMYMLFAHRQWRACLLLSEAIYSRAFELTNQNVLELGAGTGLPALTAALCSGAKKVVATDYDDASILAALRANVQRTLAINPPGAPLVVAPHTWGHAMDDVLDLLSARTPSYFDAILLADCVWERFSHAALVKSIATLLARTPTARVYMVAGLHTGRATLVHFFREMLGAGFVLTRVPGAWPACTEHAADEYLPGAGHILEIEVDGALDGGGRAPGVSGVRRPFAVHTADEEPVEVRNHWLTVSCFQWPM